MVQAKRNIKINVVKPDNVITHEKRLRTPTIPKEYRLPLCCNHPANRVLIDLDSKIEKVLLLNLLWFENEKFQVSSSRSDSDSTVSPTAPRHNVIVKNHSKRKKVRDQH